LSFWGLPFSLVRVSSFQPFFSSELAIFSLLVLSFWWEPFGHAPEQQYALPYPFMLLEIELFSIFPKFRCRQEERVRFENAKETAETEGRVSPERFEAKGGGEENGSGLAVAAQHGT
jgi:hypothetical protein